ncbi:MAG: hypothetical protein LBK52_07220, partial [Deltaproteobacteria bacterium]|nr:hypothetical protein [Deltaproteobacteria bacterium]
MDSETFLKTLDPLIGQINGALDRILKDNADFLSMVGIYGLSGGGKRLRPVLFCLGCEALGRAADEEVFRQ